MKGFIVNYRGSLKVKKLKQMIVKVDGIDKKEDTKKIIGKKVVWTSPSGKKIEGKITMRAKKRGGEIIAPIKFDRVEEIEQGGQTYVEKTVTLGTKDIEIYVGTGTGDAVIKE